MKNVDFLFIYEVKPRELENICLLKYELEKRGYSVALLNTWYYIRSKPPKYNPKVVISFALYNDNTFKFISGYVRNINKIVNMQWEQVGSNTEESDNDTLFRLSGMANHALNICWGTKTYNRLREISHINERNLYVSGHVTLDFLRDSFEDYYCKKEEILSKYNISATSRICLMVSSFSYVNLPGKIASIGSNDSLNLSNFIELSVASQEKILEWIKSYINQNPDVVFIYRPHPAESNNTKLLDIAKNNKNFRIIGDYSVKQWLTISDVIYMWYSTSLAEAYYSKKPTYILRPFKIEYERELGIYNESKTLTNFDEFATSVKSDEYSFPISKENLDKYYYVDPNEPAYIKIANKLEEVILSDYYLLPKLNKNQTVSKWIRCKRYLSRTKIYNLVEFITINSKINTSYFRRKRLAKVDGTDLYNKQMSMQNCATDDEIKLLQNKIQDVLRSNR